MEEVKPEKFGTRPRRLEKWLRRHGIAYFTGLWVVTCRAEVNNDPHQRYMIMTTGAKPECPKDLMDLATGEIPFIHVMLNEAEEKVWIHNCRNGKEGEMDFGGFKARIIEVTGCRYEESSAPGSQKAEPLSRFFRERMGKAFALTDLDFYLPGRKWFLEEKHFVRNGKAYLGKGQCRSLKETVRDVFPGSDLWIVALSGKFFYLAGIKDTDCRRSRHIKGWGEMVETGTRAVNEEELEKFLRKTNSKD